MSDLELLRTLPAVPVYVCPQPAPAVVPANVESALRCMAGALDALNQGGYSVEHHEAQDGLPGPYGIAYRAVVDLIECLHPGVDGEEVMQGRFKYDGDILAALAAWRAKWCKS